MGFIGTDEMLSGAPLPGWSGRFFHSENMTFGHWDIAEDAAELHEHDHPQEEVWNVVEGEVLLVLDGQALRLGPGDAAVIPPHMRHAARPLGACRAIIVDYPVRSRLPAIPS